MGKLIAAVINRVARQARRVTRLLLAIALVVAGLSQAAAAQTEPLLDYQVKAAMLYKFLSYTDWPDDALPEPNTPYRIGVLGSASVLQELQTLVEGRQVNGRAIEVYQVSNPNRLQHPHVLFVAADKENEVGSLAPFARRGSFMIVTESEAGLQPGSTINLRLIGGRVGFDISLASAQACHLKLSSRLLAVAATVEEGRH